MPIVEAAPRCKHGLGIAHGANANPPYLIKEKIAMRKTLKAMAGALMVLTLTAPPTSAEKAYESECGGNGCGDITDFTWSGYQWHGGSKPAGSNAYTVHANREHAETGYARYFAPLGYHGAC